MLRIKISIVPGTLLSVYIQSIAKLYSTLLIKHERTDDWDSIESLDNLMLSKLPEFECTSHLEAQERACNLVAFIKIIEEKHSNHEKMGEPFAALFEGELNPVAAKAQRKVPITEGLDLNAWIVEPEPETESEESESDNQAASPPSTHTVRQKFASAALSYMYSDDEERKDGIDEIAEEALPRRSKSKKQHKKDQIKAEMEENRRRRQFELENNPYYVKSTTPSVDSKTNSQSKPPHKKKLDTAELQSPLEIPGVIGLDRYIQQQQSTLSWKSARDEEGKSSKKSRKKGEKGEKRRKRRQALSVLSSSDEQEEAVTVHQVNRDDGELPENALPSNDEVCSRFTGS